MADLRVGYYKRQEIGKQIIKQSIEKGKTFEQIIYLVDEKSSLGELWVKRQFKRLKTNDIIRLKETTSKGDLYEFVTDNNVPVEIEITQQEQKQEEVNNETN